MPKPNQISYIEFPAADREALTAAQNFYRQVFGWQYQNWGGDYIDTQDSGVGSGMCSDHAPLLPLVVIYSDNLDAAYRQVQQAGGVITQETFEFPGGKRFHFRDPAGNELAVWSEQ
ncbi:VOC family protein [Neisseria sp.]|uniref:VOC family protein n=1 Tax=Neisseria sp. TaxID=192066 RepID=UPI0026DB6897|nr:VOC family protein [Neisseria sp.]MDO4906765.1 VOC family protein [Neisseria sp.]